MLTNGRKIYYVVEDADWVIKREGESIVRKLKSQLGLDAEVVTSSQGIKDGIIHFGSRSTYLPENYLHIDSSNKVVLTWYHGMDTDFEYIKTLPAGAGRADLIHTSCNLSKYDLIRWGAPEAKIVVIPIGVELDYFKPGDESTRLERRKALGIPPDKFVIGSFQKDGIGWQEGLEPKLEKGPDVFCDVVEAISKTLSVHVLLTGPSRGYVKTRLTNAGISFTHVNVEDYRQIGQYYSILDLYLVASRAEGGPKAIVESMASGVPVISTRVGMAPDIIADEANGLLCDIEDVDHLSRQALRLIHDTGLRAKLITNGLQTAPHYDYSILIDVYYSQIYSKLL